MFIVIFAWSILAAMLRIWQMSGQELPPVRMEEISHVKDLKASLRSLHGFPRCMQQLLHNGNSLDNSTKIYAPMDLQVVLLAILDDAQQPQAAKELAESCESSDFKVARLLFGSRCQNGH